MKFIRTTIFSLLLAANFAMASGDVQKVTFNIENMTCATCPITVRIAMQRVDGVREVSVDLESNTATVIYDATETTAAEIGTASTDVGFPASVSDGESA